ncbi:MAG: deoxyribose-phosphate aldolase [Candidatus Cloacimonetes bacterium]|jgi:deoxyribose-phosphate aldolase|nr:deoxyribose-phosphate aldolase [Candidatus Cloacimonadota bacterium]HNZ06574.1 deoxyribose-phosphate aldolase [Candidatus Cloacimonadota bacterium]HOH78523.1 deoxyribose-phosphate aldolase [Candidatus Cloacimonadota bacterium]HPN40593.1 deoxyribose-phosphate aldolase [Candidatus Cloacimonadota bacterium]
MNKIEAIARRLFPNNELCRCGGDHVICLQCAVCRADQPDQLWNPSQGIAAVIDATVLKANASQEEVNTLCEVANDHHCASVCVNSWFSHIVRLRLANPVKNCTVINFPLGAGCLEAVVEEAKAVIQHGVQEVDMVQSLSAIRSGHPKLSYDIVKAVAEVCRKEEVRLKVILETCYLSEDEIIASCLYAKKAGADFVKTSTGFGSAGATVEHIKLMRQSVGPKLGVKASGGIRDRATALAMLSAGANRIGASSVQALI